MIFLFGLSHLFDLTEDLQFIYEKNAYYVYWCLLNIVCFFIAVLRQKRGSLLSLGLDKAATVQFNSVLVTYVYQEPKCALSCWLRSGSCFYCKMCMVITTEHLPSLK